jgi:hypothetical protein
VSEHTPANSIGDARRDRQLLQQLKRGLTTTLRRFEQNQVTPSNPLITRGWLRCVAALAQYAR